ncbi:hypothetical protein MLD38_001268 [Melastoma candidum]|nr:hypothetical protein MLD38_001268 [Melastoma candidum]
MDVEDEVSMVEEVEELLAEIRKEERKERELQLRRAVSDKGMGFRKCNALMKRQAKIECEAWEQAAQEYKELIEDMCAQRLAPNLPYMKSLFLGWFEPMRNAIVKEQELFRDGKKAAHLAYFDQLPADKMAVITMYKLVALLMTGEEPGTARVVQAACTIGDAIEQEVKIHHFLEKTKRKKGKKNHETDGGSSDELSTEQEKLTFKVSNLLKKHKLPAVKQLLKGQDGFKPWSQDTKAKLPSSQLAEDPPDIRPALVTSLKQSPKTQRILAEDMA